MKPEIVLSCFPVSISLWSLFLSWVYLTPCCQPQPFSHWILVYAFTHFNIEPYRTTDPWEERSVSVQSHLGVWVTKPSRGTSGQVLVEIKAKGRHCSLDHLNSRDNYVIMYVYFSTKPSRVRVMRSIRIRRVCDTFRGQIDQMTEFSA